jgi:GTP-binding protein
MGKRPIVAIVGRPNVGKSTLLNRLVERAVAIVQDLPGTTRDRIYVDTSWMGYPLTIVDTGGLEPGASAGMAQRVKAQIRAAIEEAEVIVFLVDVRDGITSVDLEIAEELRRAGKPIVLAANKADNEKRAQEALQFYELAIGDPIPISAYHGMGIADLMDAVIAKLPPPLAVVEEAEMVKLAIVGRPNVGKSMLLNAILGQERVIVDDKPGTTRDAIDTVFHYDGQPVLLIDTAGIRRRGRVEVGVERYSVKRALQAIDRADMALLVLDAGEGIASQDTHIAGYIAQAFKGIVVVVNKWDLAEEREVDAAEYTKEIRGRLKFASYVPILYVSAKFRRGIEQVLVMAQAVAQERLKRIPTSALNGMVTEAVAAHAPPALRGKRLKILYATQVEVGPPTFVFFVNDAKLVHFSYQRYLENKLRQAFGFGGTPLRLIFKNRGEE